MVYESDFYTTRRPYTRPTASSYTVTEPGLRPISPTIRPTSPSVRSITPTTQVRRLPHLIPYIAHKRLITVVHTPIHSYYYPGATPLPIKIHSRVRPSILSAELQRIRDLPRFSQESYTSSYLNSKPNVLWDDETREIRARADALLRRIHVFVPRPLASDFAEDIVPERMHSDDYIRRLIGARKNAKKDDEPNSYYAVPEQRHFGTGNLACVSYTGGKPHSRRRPYYKLADLRPADVQSDVNMLSYYAKNRQAAASAYPDVPLTEREIRKARALENEEETSRPKRETKQEPAAYEQQHRELETVYEPEPEKVTFKPARVPIPEPEPEPIIEQKSENIIEPKSEKIVEPKREKNIATKREKIIKPQRKTIVKSEPEVIVQSEPETIPEPEPQVNVQSEPQTIAEPEPEVVVKSEPEMIAEPEPEVIVKSEPETIAEPEPEVIVQSEPETIPQQEPEMIVEPETQSIVEPEMEIIAEPEAEPIVELKSEVIAETETETMITTEEPEVIEEPKAEQTVVTTESEPVAMIEEPVDDATEQRLTNEEQSTENVEMRVDNEEEAEDVLQRKLDEDVLRRQVEELKRQAEAEERRRVEEARLAEERWKEEEEERRRREKEERERRLAEIEEQERLEAERKVEEERWEAERVRDIKLAEIEKRAAEFDKILATEEENRYAIEKATEEAHKRQEREERLAAEVILGTTEDLHHPDGSYNECHCHPEVNSQELEERPESPDAEDDTQIEEEECGGETDHDDTTDPFIVEHEGFNSAPAEVADAVDESPIIEESSSTSIDNFWDNA